MRRVRYSRQMGDDAVASRRLDERVGELRRRGAPGLPLSAAIVGRQHRFDEPVGRDVERFVVHAFVGRDGPLGNGEQAVARRLGQADVRERDGQAGAYAKIKHFLEFGCGAAFEDKLNDRAECDLFAVQKGVRFGRRGEAVVDRVRGETGGFVSQARGACGLDD